MLLVVIDCLASSILQNTLICVQQKIYTGLDQLEGE